jgi:hypothetical protein
MSRRRRPVLVLALVEVLIVDEAVYEEVVPEAPDVGLL